MRWSEWIYRLLLRAYPRRFRDRFGRDLLEVFRAQRAEPHYAGTLGTIRFWRDMAWDWGRAMIESRRRPVALRSPGGTRGMGGVMMDALRQDLKFAFRGLLRSPGFTVVTVVTLAVGIGANAAMFGVVRSVLLAPLPYGTPDGVVTLWSSWVDDERSWVSDAEYRAYLTQSRAFEDLAAWSEVNVTFTDPRNPERVLAVGATPNLVDVLDVGMPLGRFFSVEEAIRADTATADVIVVSHEAWQRRWNGDPSIVGSRTEMNGRSREVVGVMPEGFRLPTQFGTVEVADVYFPSWIAREPVSDFPLQGGSHGWFVAGRLDPAHDAASAARELESVIARINAEFGAYPVERGFAPLVESAEEYVLGSVRPALLALFGTVVFVLLIASANVANMMLARADDRLTELSVREALGAGRRRLVAQLTVESLLLAAVGGLLGLTLAALGVDAFKALATSNLPRVDEVVLDASVFAFTAGVALSTVLLFGVWPAYRVTRGPLASTLRGAGGGSRRSGWLQALVSAQTALALVLAVGAGLMARTFEGLTSIDPGFHGENVLSAALSLPSTRYPDPQASAAFWRELLQRVSEIPGVERSGAVRALPLAGQIGDWGLDIEGYDETVKPRANGDWQIVTPGYFETMGIPLIRGRLPTWADDEAVPLAVVINETLSEAYWPGEDPVGRAIRVGDGPWGRVVGVVGDVRHNGLTEEMARQFYVPVAQWGVATGGNPTSLRLVVAARGSTTDVVDPVRAAVRELDPSLAIAEVRAVKDVLSATVAQPLLMAVLMSVFGGIAFLLALVGVYGVISYAVGTRRKEIGVRIALGAMHDEVVGLILRGGAGMVGVGIAAGTLAALLLTRVVESLLYGVSPTDPLTFLAVLAGFTVVALTATWLPSRRAARVDPMRVLKSE